MNEHDWKFTGSGPMTKSYWFKCDKCGTMASVSEEQWLDKRKPNPSNSLCIGDSKEVKKENPWKDAVLNAMKSYNMDIAHYENEPDNAVCDLLYMHANVEAHRAMMDYFSKEGDSKG
jgi:hypothetical protein